MGKQQNATVTPKKEDEDLMGLEAFYNSMSPITSEEFKMQKRSILQATPNKYTRYELKKLQGV